MNSFIRTLGLLFAVPLSAMCIDALVCSSCTASDYTTLQVGSSEVVLAANWNWYPTGLRDHGHEFMAAGNGSANGAVIQLDGEWSGGTHGYESLEVARLLVDDAEVELQNNAKYTGQRITLDRQFTLDNAYRVSHRLTLENGKVTNDYHYTGLDSRRSANVIYASLGTRSNRLTEAHLLQNDDVLASFSASSDARAMLVLSDSWDGFTGVKQFDPLARNAVITQWQIPSEDYSGMTQALSSQPNTELYIWDRDTDNKLYLRFRDFEGTADKTFRLREVIRFKHEATPVMAASVAKVPEPSSCSLILLLLGIFSYQRIMAFEGSV